MHIEDAAAVDHMVVVVSVFLSKKTVPATAFLSAYSLLVEYDPFLKLF
jgi:hypothetical protein